MMDAKAAGHRAKSRKRLTVMRVTGLEIGRRMEPEPQEGSSPSTPS